MYTLGVIVFPTHVENHAGDPASAHLHSGSLLPSYALKQPQRFAKNMAPPSRRVQDPNPLYKSHEGALHSAPSSSPIPLRICHHPFTIKFIMFGLGPALLVSLLAFQNTFALPGTSHANIEKRDLDSWIATQGPHSLTKLLCNIGSEGCNAQGVASGAVVASPSKTEPPYWYTWSRDSALVFKYILDKFESKFDESLQAQVQNYIIAQAKVQGISNPSGSLTDGSGLGEPKYEVNLTAFTGDWGRPQRDGPPLRAAVLIGYGNWLIDNGYRDTAESSIWPILVNDLAYVVQYWNQGGFDLWEEVNGNSFFTTAAQHRALVEGIAFAARLGKSCDNCATVAPQILCFQQKFWNSDGNYIVSNINVDNGRKGIDVNSILTSIHNFDPAGGCDDPTFQPCSDRALANHKAVTDSFRSIYPINAGIAQGAAVAVGRYSEDVYFKGNPWYLATFAAAEQLYDALYQWDSVGAFAISDVSLGFFKDIYPEAAVGTYKKDSEVFTAVAAAVKTYADGFMVKAQEHTPKSGDFAEQYDRSTGSPLSAADLTWSYASFLSAADRRAGVIPASWGSITGNKVPAGDCGNSAYSGSYSHATDISFPANQTPGTEGPTPTVTSPVPSPTSCLIVQIVAVTFKEVVTTQPGQTIKLVGSVAKLGSWNPANAVVLSSSEYTDSNHLWSVSVDLPAGTKLEYKFINVAEDGTVTWESDPNRQYSVRVACDKTATVSSDWK
ncbi:hypothetical protein V490_01898 [Pseudogymnoascus sp. VKM F-3557]|nr:hypothetical protein V490_01898 [Pseudogymnoascus sp. VKM F-3557]